MKRKIAAILAADVAGYSRLVAEDEEETLMRLASYRKVFEDFISRAGGRIFNTAGDAVLAEFPSAVEAVRCAIDIQESMRTRNIAYPQHRRMDFRIGLTIGDVVERDGDLLGDGVNIAARLEGLAQPGGICISQSVYDAVANKIGVEFKDIGQQEVKNIPRPVHAFLIGPQPVAAMRKAVLGETKTDNQASSMNKGALAASALALLVVGAGGAALWFRSAPPPVQPVAVAPPPAAEKPAETVAQTAPPPAPSVSIPRTPPQVEARPPEKSPEVAAVIPPAPAPPQLPAAAESRANEAKPAETPEPKPAEPAQTAPALPSDPAEAYRVLAQAGGIVAAPKTAPEFYHNARSYEIRGDAAAARRAYAAFAGLKMNVIDPLLRLAGLLRVQEGRAGAREALTDLVSQYPTPAAIAVHALQFDGADRRARLEKFVAEHPDFSPARYLLAEEFSEDRLGIQQTLSDRRREMENLALFLNADRDGKLQPFFMDHSVLSDWLEKARKRLAIVERYMSTVSAEPVMTYIRSNTGWIATVGLPEASSEIAWRLRPEDEFRSTPTIANIDPRTGKPMPMPNFELPSDLEKATIQIRYRDASGNWVGPFDMPFEWRSVLAKSQRTTLELFKSGWVAFRNDAPYENNLYFTHLVSYRCAIARVELGFGDGPVGKTLPLALPPCDRKDPHALPNNYLPYLKIPPGTKQVTVKLTYVDGTEAEPVTIKR